MQSVLTGMSTTLEFPLETQTCCSFSWRIMLSSHHDHMDMHGHGNGQELQRRQSTYLWRSSSANLPRNSSSALLPFYALTGCDSTLFIREHSKKTAWKVLQSTLIFSPRWAKTSSMLTPSHPQRSLFVECIRHRRTWLVLCYLAKSVAQKNYHRLVTRSSNT